MGHFVVFLNFIILGFGIGVAIAYFRLYRSWPEPKTFWQLFLFLAFTFTMAAAALGAYMVVNIGFQRFVSRFLASLVLIGSSGMLLALPHGAWARLGRKNNRSASLFWAFISLIPISTGIAFLFIKESSLMIVLIILSFLPLIGSIVYSLYIELGVSTQQGKGSWIALAVLSFIAALEISYAVRRPPDGGYFLVTLPIAYLYICCILWKSRSRPTNEGEGIDLSFPESLGKDKGLTDREIEIARGILEGKSNKELAYELSICENTVRNHIYNLYRKLGVQKRLDLVLLVRKYHSS